jgi:hypothetical protein
MVLAAGMLTTGLAAATASPASAASEITVCLKNAPKWCADVRNNSNTAGTRIWLWSNGSDDKWIETTNVSCVAGVCFNLEDAQNTSLCLTATGTNGAEIKLEKCNNAGSWYNEGGNMLGNGFYGANGSLIANAAGQGDYLYSSRTGAWHQWSW